jgi:hypothetical protein
MYRQTETELINRFWTKVNITSEDECWNWIGHSKTPQGSGVAYNGDIATSASRVAYEFTFGKIFNGLYVLHKCDNNLCCNPKHLYLGTQSQNMCDRESRYKGLSKFGRPSGLSTDDISNIKKMWFNDRIKQEEIGSMFNIDQTTVSKIVNNRYNQRR